MQMHANKFQQLLRLGYLHGSDSANGQFLNLGVVSEVSLEGLRDGTFCVSASIDLEIICVYATDAHSAFGFAH